MKIYDIYIYIYKYTHTWLYIVYSYSYLQHANILIEGCDRLMFFLGFQWCLDLGLFYFQTCSSCKW